MSKLPEKFPEYSIMYKTISKQIDQLENQRADSTNNKEIDTKIESYKKELEKIRKMF